MRAVLCWPLVVLVTIGCKEDEAKKQSERLKKEAEEAAAQADQAAKEATAKLERLMKDQKDVDDKVNAAITAIADAQNDADRASAKARLVALQKEQAELRDRVFAARTAAEAAERLRPMKASKECQDNPHAPGCS